MSAPGPEVPEEVMNGIGKLEAALRRHEGDGGSIEGAVEACHALLSAISRALADAREGALREAAEIADVEYRHGGHTAAWIIGKAIRALASPPPAQGEEGGR